MNTNADKRTRLIEAADVLFHKQGVSTTTLAHIAALSDVPLGNVYYYFKSKESIITAVLNKRHQCIQAQLTELNGLAVGGKERLLAFINHNFQSAEQILAHGDILGSLCLELSKQGGELANSVSKLVEELIQWCTKQFESFGQVEHARLFSINILSCLQGISLMALTLKSQDVIDSQTSFLKNWLNNLTE